MRRMTAAALLTAVLVSSLPWEMAGLPDVTDGLATAEARAETRDARDTQESAPTTDSCVCLCIVCPGAAVEGFWDTPGISALPSFVRTNSVQSDQTHPYEVLSRLFRPPRSA